MAQVDPMVPTMWGSVCGVREYPWAQVETLLAQQRSRWWLVGKEGIVRVQIWGD